MGEGWNRPHPTCCYQLRGAPGRAYGVLTLLVTAAGGLWTEPACHSRPWPLQQAANPHRQAHYGTANGMPPAPLPGLANS